MSRAFHLTTLAATLIGIGLAAQTAYAIFTLPIPLWTAISVAEFFVILAIGIIAIWRNPSDIFAPTLALLGTLVIGRLLSTLRLEGVSLASLDPLLVAETGPGIPAIAYTSVALFIVLAFHML
ncbi:hypothetical protein [Sulfitobacter sp.]|uniref:hypothetical protein n=1 Tax=Sulfitobacter sp. TaxID=1903071 RepID=UPI003002B268